MKTCPKCGNEHERNGKFCSPSCANSRTWTEEDKKKKSFSLTLDEELLGIFENYLDTNKVKNKSKYIVYD